MSSNALSAGDPLMDGLLGDFLDESTGLLQQLNEGLLRLDELIRAAATPPDPSKHSGLLNDMFRAAHSLKGLSGMMRLDNVNGLTHKIENIFDAARNGTLPITSEAVELVFQGVDRLEAMIALLQEPTGKDVEYSDVLKRIESLLAASGVNKAATLSSAEIAAMAAASATTTPAAGPEAHSSHVCSTRDESLSKITNDADIPEKYIAIFIDESEQTLEEISEQLLAGERPGITQSLLTTCHRLKGSAASIGLLRVAHVAHRMEDLLQFLCGQGRGVEGPLTDAMLNAVDAIRSFVSGMKTGAGTSNDNLEPAYQALHDAIETAKYGLAEGARLGQQATPQSTDLSAIHRAAPDDKPGFAGRVAFEPKLDLAGLKACLLMEKLLHLGELFHQHPSPAELEQCDSLDMFEFGIVTEITEEMLQASLLIQGVANIRLEALNPDANSSPQNETQDTNAISPSQAKGPGDSPAPLATTSPVDHASPRQSTPGPIGEANGSEGSRIDSAATTAKNKPAETLRVDIDRLDQLMSLAGQLVINKARFAQINTQLKNLSHLKSTLHCASTATDTVNQLSMALQDSFQKAQALDTDNLRALTMKLANNLKHLQKELGELTTLRGTVNELNEAVHQLGRVSDGIQSTVMDTRMVPIGPLFTRFKRVVRDLSRDNHKQIELLIYGENTELDKRMIDELGDPLIHLIRNAADHGIEVPEQRVAAGKPPHGTITLNAFQRGNRIVLQIADDGRGLDADRIRNKGLAKGLITQAEAERMTPQQLYQLIWKPGFSTAERITEVSGRGMGMDIVLSKIEQLNGVVEVLSETGQGTRFEIKLPLTMAIVPSLLTVVDDEVYAIPVESILEIVQISNESLPTVQGQVTARVRNRIISVVELGDVFAWERPATPPREAKSLTTLVIVGHDGHELAITVDDLLGEQDVVIKSLEENFENLDGIAGASILGDGRVSLILDVSALMTMVRQRCSLAELYQDQPELARMA